MAIKKMLKKVGKAFGMEKDKGYDEKEIIVKKVTKKPIKKAKKSSAKKAASAKKRMK